MVLLQYYTVFIVLFIRNRYEAIYHETISFAYLYFLIK